MRVRQAGALHRPARQDLRERAGAADAFARLLPLRALRGRLLPARPRAGPAGRVALARRAAHGRSGGRDGQLRGRPRVARPVGWNLATEHFPDAIQIVDRFHAKQHLSDVAKSIYGAGSDLGEQWAKQRHDELDEGKLDDLLAALRVHADANEEARKCLDYVTGNRHRMRYPEFRAQGLCTSTGVVEAGCKTAIGTRCKRAGMHWTVAGADAIIALRCCKLSGRFEDFWERRSSAVAAG